MADVILRSSDPTEFEVKRPKLAKEEANLNAKSKSKITGAPGKTDTKVRHSKLSAGSPLKKPENESTVSDKTTSQKPTTSPSSQPGSAKSAASRSHKVQSVKPTDSKSREGTPSSKMSTVKAKLDAASQNKSHIDSKPTPATTIKSSKAAAGKLQKATSPVSSAVKQANPPLEGKNSAKASLSRREMAKTKSKDGSPTTVKKENPKGTQKPLTTNLAATSSSKSMAAKSGKQSSSKDAKLEVEGGKQDLSLSEEVLKSKSSSKQSRLDGNETQTPNKSKHVREMINRISAPSSAKKAENVSKQGVANVSETAAKSTPGTASKSKTTIVPGKGSQVSNKQSSHKNDGTKRASLETQLLGQQSMSTTSTVSAISEAPITGSDLVRSKEIEETAPERGNSQDVNSDPFTRLPESEVNAPQPDEDQCGDCQAESLKLSSETDLCCETLLSSAQQTTDAFLARSEDCETRLPSEAENDEQTRGDILNTQDMAAPPPANIEALEQGDDIAVSIQMETILESSISLPLVDERASMQDETHGTDADVEPDTLVGDFEKGELLEGSWAEQSSSKASSFVHDESHYEIDDSALNESASDKNNDVSGEKMDTSCRHQLRHHESEDPDDQCEELCASTQGSASSNIQLEEDAQTVDDEEREKHLRSWEQSFDSQDNLIIEGGNGLDQRTIASANLGEECNTVQVIDDEAYSLQRGEMIDSSSDMCEESYLEDGLNVKGTEKTLNDNFLAKFAQDERRNEPVLSRCDDARSEANGESIQIRCDHDAVRSESILHHLDPTSDAPVLRGGNVWVPEENDSNTEDTSHNEREKLHSFVEPDDTANAPTALDAKEEEVSSCFEPAVVLGARQVLEAALSNSYGHFEDHSDSSEPGCHPALSKFPDYDKIAVAKEFLEFDENTYEKEFGMTGDGTKIDSLSNAQASVVTFTDLPKSVINVLGKEDFDGDDMYRVTPLDDSKYDSDSTSPPCIGSNAESGLVYKERAKESVTVDTPNHCCHTYDQENENSAENMEWRMNACSSHEEDTKDYSSSGRSCESTITKEESLPEGTIPERHEGSMHTMTHHGEQMAVLSVVSDSSSSSSFSSQHTIFEVEQQHTPDLRLVLDDEQLLDGLHTNCQGENSSSVELQQAFEDSNYDNAHLAERAVQPDDGDYSLEIAQTLGFNTEAQKIETDGNSSLTDCQDRDGSSRQGECCQNLVHEQEESFTKQALAGKDADVLDWEQFHQIEADVSSNADLRGEGAHNTLEHVDTEVNYASEAADLQSASVTSSCDNFEDVCKYEEVHEDVGGCRAKQLSSQNSSSCSSIPIAFNQSSAGDDITSQDNEHAREDPFLESRDLDSEIRNFENECESSPKPGDTEETSPFDKDDDCISDGETRTTPVQLQHYADGKYAMGAFSGPTIIADISSDSEVDDDGTLEEIQQQYQDQCTRSILQSHDFSQTFDNDLKTDATTARGEADHASDYDPFDQVNIGMVTIPCDSPFYHTEEKVEHPSHEYTSDENESPS